MCPSRCRWQRPLRGSHPSNRSRQSRTRPRMPTPVIASVPAIIAQKVSGICFPQAAVIAHVLFVVHRVDHAACAKEQQRLEEGVGEQVEHRRAIGADARGEEHVAQLRTGRIGDHALDVPLRRADRRGEEAGRRADEGDDGQRIGRGLEHRRQAADHEHARGHHRRGVDQRGDRASGLPSRPAARCAGRAAPTCPSRR